MVDPLMQQILARLAAQDKRVAVLERRRARVRRAPALLAALLAALIPFALLAATPFTDLNPGSVHNDNIDAIYAAGVTTGCVPNQEYCPNDNVTRQEMASFLARLGGLGANPPVANAQALQGYAPSGLVRAARGRQAIRSAGLPHGGESAPFVDLANLRLDAPGSGFILLSGTFQAIRGDGGGFARIEYRLRDVTGGEAAPPQAFTLGPGVNMLVGSTTTLLAVPAVGLRTYVLEARNASNDTNAYAEGGEFVALFVPFGATGGTSLGP